MGRYRGPKFKLDRREKANLFLKGSRSVSTKHPFEKKGAVPPGQHGPKSVRRKSSDFALQLREKQKVKRMYGLLERQFKKYFLEASKEKGNTGEALFKQLETRLDNVVYRLGFAPSRAAARQFVSHGHVRVNGDKVNVPSFKLKRGDVVSLAEKSQKLPLVEEGLRLREDNYPDWLERKALAGKVVKDPSSEDLEMSVDKQLIIEFYSR